MEESTPSMETVACPECDLLQHLPELPSGGKARCPRCGWVVASRSADPLDRPLALTLTALIALIVANTAPLMDLSAVGLHASTTIIGGAYEMWLQGQEITAAIVLFRAVIAPAGYCSCSRSSRREAATRAAVGWGDVALGRLHAA